MISGNVGLLEVESSRWTLYFYSGKSHKQPCRSALK